MAKAKQKLRADGEPRGRTGRFTYYPDKVKARSVRLTPRGAELFDKLGQQIKDPTNVDDAGKAKFVSVQDVLETVLRKFEKNGAVSLADVRKFSKIG